MIINTYGEHYDKQHKQASKQASKQAKFKLSLIALSIFSFSHALFAQEADTTVTNSEAATTKPIINQEDSEVTAINSSGSIFSTYNDGYNLDSTWQWGKWQKESDKSDVLHFEPNPNWTDRDGKLRPNENQATWIHALNDEGNVAAGYVTRTPSAKFLEERKKLNPSINVEILDPIVVPVIWKWEGEKWSAPIALPYEDNIYEANNNFFGRVKALNSAGDIATGYSVTSYNKEPIYANVKSVATVWTEKNNTWTKTFLPHAEGEVHSSGNAINGQGNIVVGQVDKKATIWKFNGNTWDNAQNLPSATTNSNSEAFAINKAGDVIGGLESPNEDMNGVRLKNVPIVWFGKDLTPTVLKNTKSQFAEGEVKALSANGKIAAGYLIEPNEDNSENKSRATIWTGKNWKAYSLNSFTSNGMGYSKATAMNDDGTIVGGEAEFDDGNTYAALWHIQYNKENEVENNKILTDKTDISSIVITPINVYFTNKALGEMANSSFALLGQQYHGLKRVQKGCYTDEQGFCYRTYGDWSNADSAQDLNAGLSLGYQFGNGILVGATLDHSLTRSLPTNYQQTNSNLGLGLFARLDHGNWYVSPSIAWNYYDAKLKRNQYAFTESEEQKARVKGFALGLTVGQDFKLDNKGLAGWYTTLSTMG